MTEQEINKLPKWAQREVRTLQMNLNEATAEVIRLKSNTESNTMMGYGGMVGDLVQYLRNNALIRFKLPDGEISAYIKEGVLNINASAIGNFCIIPRASNACELKFTK